MRHSKLKSEHFTIISEQLLSELLDSAKARFIYGTDEESRRKMLSCLHNRFYAPPWPDVRDDAQTPSCFGPNRCNCYATSFRRRVGYQVIYIICSFCEQKLLQNLIENALLTVNGKNGVPKEFVFQSNNSETTNFTIKIGHSGKDTLYLIEKQTS